MDQDEQINKMIRKYNLKQNKECFEEFLTNPSEIVVCNFINNLDKFNLTEFYDDIKNYNYLDLKILFIKYSSVKEQYNLLCDEKIEDIPDDILINLFKKYGFIKKYINKYVEFGFDVNEIDSNRNTPLIIACRNNDLDLVKKLIIKKCNINVENNNGDFPLQIACSHKNIEMIKLLLNNGADANYKFKSGDTILHRLCDSSHVDINIIELFIKNANLNIRNYYYQTPYIIALDNYNFKMMRLLHKNGADDSYLYAKILTYLIIFGLIIIFPPLLLIIFIWKFISCVQKN